MKPYLFAAVFLFAAESSAWMIEGSVTHGCHERMAMDALDEVGYVSAVPDLVGDDRLLYDSMGFDTSFVDRNTWAMSLVLGVRYWDVWRYSSIDLSLLTYVHNDDPSQVTHCLRTASQDFEGGDVEAAHACRQLIRDEMALAWDAVDASSEIDASLTEQVEVYLLYQGSTWVPVSTFYFHVGRAMHTVQDSFTHTFRTADKHSIVEVHNWIEDASGDRVTHRDGPAHDGSVDDCRCSRGWMQELKAANHQASVDLLAVASMSGTRDEREAALEVFLDDWMTHLPDCDADNGYCASPDPEDRSQRACGSCSFVGPVGGAGGAAGAGLAVVLLLGLVISRRRAW